MANRTRPDNVDLVPAAEPDGAAYDRDFYSWLMEQARHLRAARWDALDRENLAEEIESLGREQFNRLESALRTFILHMLKWDHQPGAAQPLLVGLHQRAAAAARRRARRQSGLRPRIDEAITRAYRRARLRAIKETDLEPERFPETCPYSWQDDCLSRFLALNDCCVHARSQRRARRRTPHPRYPR